MVARVLTWTNTYPANPINELLCTLTIKCMEEPHIPYSQFQYPTLFLLPLYHLNLNSTSIMLYHLRTTNIITAKKTIARWKLWDSVEF